MVRHLRNAVAATAELQAFGVATSPAAFRSTILDIDVLGDEGHDLLLDNLSSPAIAHATGNTNRSLEIQDLGLVAVRIREPGNSAADSRRGRSWANDALEQSGQKHLLAVGNVERMLEA